MQISNGWKSISRYVGNTERIPPSTGVLNSCHLTGFMSLNKKCPLMLHIDYVCWLCKNEWHAPKLQNPYALDIWNRVHWSLDHLGPRPSSAICNKMLLESIFGYKTFSIFKLWETKFLSRSVSSIISFDFSIHLITLSCSSPLPRQPTSRPKKLYNSDDLAVSGH